MTQKYIQAYPSTFTQVNSQGFAAEDGSIALDVTGTCTKHPWGPLSSCKRALHGHPGAFYRDGKQSSFLRHCPVTEDPTPQALPLTANKRKAHVFDVPSPPRDANLKENTILPQTKHLFPRKLSIP